MELSIADLRGILFNIKTQDMTIRELRSKLFLANECNYPEQLTNIEDWILLLSNEKI